LKQNIWETVGHCKLKISLPFVESEGSVSCAQQFTTGP
jgi:hypothetical protein